MQGYNIHRHKSNTREKELHDKFIEEFIASSSSDNTINRIIFGHHNHSFNPKDVLSEREKKIVLSTIQWLGSPVGTNFLKHCGYKYDNNKKEDHE